MDKQEPMSSSYADGLSPYENKGKLGLNETFDSRDEMKKKVSELATWIKEAKHIVVHTGAGISTAAGIPDFRGPQGVWTLEAKGLKPKVNISFNNATPTKTHMALVKLVQEGYVKYVVSQNIDGLHLRSGLPRTTMSELHGNMFTEQCSHCERLFIRDTATKSVGQRCLETSCPVQRPGGRPCRGKVHDTILDWEANLPERELCMAEWHSNLADLSITLGTTLQILPSGNLPLQAKKRGGRLVVCNLQPTKHDRKADLIVHDYVDDILEELFQHLCLEIPNFSKENDPTLLAKKTVMEWTITTRTLEKMRRLHTQLCKPIVKRTSTASVSSTKKVKTEDIEEQLDLVAHASELCSVSESVKDEVIKVENTEIRRNTSKSSDLQKEESNKETIHAESSC